MNDYGYDYYIPNDSLYFDEQSYIDTIKPLDKIENFENDINKLLDDDNSLIKKMYEQKNQFCENLKTNYKQCINLLQQKNYELSSNNNNLTLLYILLIFAIIFIFYQRISINSLNQLIYILKWNIKNNNQMLPKI
jgi:hypothetical protein